MIYHILSVKQNLFVSKTNDFVTFTFKPFCTQIIQHLLFLRLMVSTIYLYNNFTPPKQKVNYVISYYMLSQTLLPYGFPLHQ